MPDAVNALQTVGIDVGGDKIRAAHLGFEKGKPKILGVYTIAIPESEENVNPLDMTEEGKELGAFIEKELSVTALPTHQVLVRQLDLKLKKERDIEQVLSFQAEPLIPFPIEDGILDWMLLDQLEDGTRISLLAARKDHVGAHLETWQKRGVEPEVVSSIPAALTAFANTYSTLQDLYFVVNLGAEYSTCVLVKEGRLIAAQSVHFGIAALPDEGQERERVIEQWRSELTRILYSLEKQAKREEARTILVTGEGAFVAELPQSLLGSMDKEIVEPAGDNVRELQEYAIAIGLALTALPKADWQVNFRQKEYAYPNPWRRLIKPVGIYFAGCLFLAWALNAFGNAYLGYQQDQIKEQYAELLAFADRPYAVFEEEYVAKFQLNGPLTLKKLSNDDLLSRIGYLEKEIKAAPDTIALLPDVPSVSDVLAWLAVHPQVSKKTDKGIESLLQIDTFHYVMVQRPEEKKRQNRYQVKVEMEFTSPNPSLAREFHDALIAPNDIVDPKAEVKWSSSRGKYRTSFFLKDKTKYPSGQKP